MQEKIFFYYTSDLHSYFENWPKITYFLQRKITERNKHNQDYFLLDNGDHIDRVNPISEALKGKGNVELLNKANYDVINLGNNEGITLTKEELTRLYADAEFKIACANLSCQDGSDPEWLQPYQILTTDSGVKIGVIGLTAPFADFYSPLGWQIDDPLETLRQYLAQLKGKTDAIILLSHLGVDPDRVIAEQYPEIDVIIGGHTHHLFETEEVYEEAILTGVGKSGFYVGEVCLTWDHQQRKLINKTAIAHPIPDDHVDQETVALIKKQQAESDLLLSKEVVKLKEPLEVDWHQETFLIKQLTETLKDWTKADVAMLNAGILLEGFEQGVVTERDVHRICPHPINPCVVSVTGQELLEIVRAGLAEAYQQIQVKGYGFRGKVMGVLVYAGLGKEDHENKQFIDQLIINGQPLDLNQSYRLATADMFTFEHLSPQISRAQVKEFYLPEFMRDLLRRTLRQISNK
ncbi:MAG TPA: bifunctional metallophosphatase/5'-nucleotidase [Bacilli bacterium]|nr:bifunctional metallophosphatase/5'-nucleotidase [Bacilli bacterium]